MARARVALFLLIVPTYISTIRCECSVDLSKAHNSSSPLFLDKLTFKPVYPPRGSGNALTLSADKDYALHCFGAKLSFSNAGNDAEDAAYERLPDILPSRCLRGQTFYSPEYRLIYDFENVFCSGNPKPMTRQEGSRGCTEDGVLVEVGYELGPGRFERTFELCHLAGLATTSWAHGDLRPLPGSPGFGKGAYFGDLPISQLYSRSSQLRTFLSIFDADQRLLDRYLPLQGPRKNYLVQGQLVGHADLFYPAEQYSTYTYANALPVWESVSNGNWRSVESMLRRIAATRELHVWTGGLGVLELAGRPIYLGRERGNASRPLLPVPRLLFKLVVAAAAAAAQEALVFVTANDPYLDRHSEQYQICPQHRQCAQAFPHFQRTFQGYTYCCTYEHFMAHPEVRKLRLPVELKNVSPLKLH